MHLWFYDHLLPDTHDILTKNFCHFSSDESGNKSAVATIPNELQTDEEE